MQRIRDRFLRRSSTASSAKSVPKAKTPFGDPNRGQSEASLPNPSVDDGRGRLTSVGTEQTKRNSSSQSARPSTDRRPVETSLERPVANTAPLDAEGPLQSPPDSSRLPSPTKSPLFPKVTLEAPTPEAVSRRQTQAEIRVPALDNAVRSIPEEEEDLVAELGPASAPLYTPGQPTRPDFPLRRQSLVPATQQRLIKTLLDSEQPGSQAQHGDYFTPGLASINANMIHRKVWVKRPGQSATLVSIAEDDLVDDVRDVILRKYANSLGRNFDAPDVTLRIASREPPSRGPALERVLGPEEPIGRTLDSYYPGGQTVDEALIIDVPQRRTPRPSPRHSHPMPYYITDDMRPGEGGEYFPPMPINHSPHLASGTVPAAQPGAHHPSVHAMSVLTTGQLPPLPSPGSITASKGSRHSHRPKYGRQHTSSPTVMGSAPPSSSSLTDPNHPVAGSTAPPAPPLPTPPPVEDHKPSLTPPIRSASPRPGPKTRKGKRINNNRANPPAASAANALPAGLLDGTVPPINVLIVEDNVINMRLLEAFMKRLKVRWQTAMNGREAVTKWRNGGFHLVLMDIQLPVMNGLEATKEIRRLERLNNIGVFSSSAATSPEEPRTPASRKSPTSERVLREPRHEPEGDDVLENLSLFKSPVIIVALTASSLQSDRHEALAAGCNDFLTKPVNFVWLERKVTEWGCMQALIDFDGWRKWKDFAASTESSKASLKAGLVGAQKDDSSTSSKKNSSTSIARDHSSSDSTVVLNGKPKKGATRRKNSSDLNLESRGTLLLELP